jgi:hypothetical protein
MVELRDGRWDTDVEALIIVIEKILTSRTDSKSPWSVVKDLLDFVLDNSLPLSLLANGLVVVLLLSGYASITADRGIQAQVDSLFSSNNTLLLQGPLIQKLQSLDQSDPVAQQLRKLSQDNAPPFGPKKLQVTATTLPSLRDGVLEFCMAKKAVLNNMHLVIWNDHGGFPVKQVQWAPGACSPIKISPHDWLKLKGTNAQEVSVTLDAYLYPVEEPSMPDTVISKNP